LKASIFEYVMANPKQVWLDRFGVDIETTPFLGDIVRDGRHHSSGSLSGEAAARYQKASRIATQSIPDYTGSDFRSLGSFTRQDLERIAGAAEASQKRLYYTLV
jgi:hypothetical protein